MAVGNKELEKTFKAVGNKRRIMILAALKKRKSMKVGAIADEIKLSFRATSKHMGVLYTAGLVEREQHSLEMHYRIAEDMTKAAQTVIGLL